jgi:hypothetical protein
LRQRSQSRLCTPVPSLCYSAPAKQACFRAAEELKLRKPRLWTCRCSRQSRPYYSAHCPHRSARHMFAGLIV